jgi:hypothetical protein
MDPAIAKSAGERGNRGNALATHAEKRISQVLSNIHKQGDQRLFSVDLRRAQICARNAFPRFPRSPGP